MLAKSWKCLLFFFLFFSFQLQAQPKWVKLAFNEGKNSTLGKEADVLVLRDFATVEVDDDKSAELKLQVAYKIITKDGEDYATIKLPTSRHVKSKVKGWLKKRDGSVHKLEDESIIEIGLMASGAYFDEGRQLIASFDQVEPGDMVAFEAKVEENDWNGCFQNFAFQKDQPVLLTKFTVIIPEGWQLNYSTWNMDGIELKVQGQRYTWIGRNLPLRKKEPLSPPWSYLVRRISVAVFNPNEMSPTRFKTWENVGNWLANVYQKPAQPGRKIASLVETITSNAGTTTEKIRAIAEYVQNNIRYVAIEVGKGRWLPRPAEKTLFNGYGDCKDKCTLMRAMLDVAGIPSVPVLVNATSLVDPDLPSPSQFNHVIVGIPTSELDLSPELKNAIKDGWLYFDPTDPSTGLGQIPWSLQGNFVILGGHLDSLSYRLPFPAPASYARRYRLNGQIKNTGEFEADIVITSYGGWASNDRFKLSTRSKKEQKQQWYKQLGKSIPDVRILQYETRDEGDSVQVILKIAGRQLLTKSGERWILKPDIFEQWKPAQLTAKKRKYPIWFGPPKQVKKSIRWQFPAEWKVTLNESELAGKCKGAEVKLKLTARENVLHCNSFFQRTGRLVPVEEYSVARAFSHILSRVQGKSVWFSTK